MTTAIVILGLFALAGAVASFVAALAGMVDGLDHRWNRAGLILFGALAGAMLVYHAGGATWAVIEAQDIIAGGACCPCADGGE